MSGKEDDQWIRTLETLELMTSSSTMEAPAFSSTQMPKNYSNDKEQRDRRKTMLPQKQVLIIDEEFENSEDESDDQKQSYDQNSITVAGHNNNKESSDLNAQANKTTKNEQIQKVDTSKLINEPNIEKFVEPESDEIMIVNDEYDSFILQNIEPYTGEGDVSCWLDKTEKFFKQNNIGRNARFNSISLLVDNEAKRKYIKSRSKIRCYDDFYEFLLNEYDHSDNMSHSNNFSQTVHNQVNTVSAMDQKNMSNDSNTDRTFDSKSVNRKNQSSFFKANNVANNDVIDSVGEKSARKTPTSTDNLSCSFSDPTLNDIRKAIVGDLIKNPKTFKGAKDDVKKWLEDIEHLFEIAHIQDSTRLDLISYSLRGDALEWFKHNKASITSWKAFVTEIKRAFTSLYLEELAFKKLEAYSQGENQSVRNFYNDVLKLCKEADPAMSDATKLKNLLGKTKSSIQLEVRKKKPTSTAEFLDFAKEVEELLQLSNMSNDTTSSGNKVQNFSFKPKSSFQSKTKPNFNRSWNRSSNNSFSRELQHSENDNRSQPNSSAPPNRNDSSFSPKNQKHQNQFKSNQYSSQNSGQRSSNATDNKNSQKDQTPRNTVSKSTYVPSKTVNTIDTSRQSSNTEETLETLSSAICNQCGQFGHETSVCPNF
jgi:hypothetical protein